MRSRSSILVGLAFISAVGSNVVAQTPARLESGARARLVTPSLPAGQQIVQIEATANDTVVFRSERYPVTRSLALSEISAVDVSLGQRRRTLRGAGIGLAAGATIGAVAGYATYEPCNGWCFFGPSSPEGAAAWGGAAGGVLGLVAGTTIGFLMKSEKWQRVQSNTSIAITPTRGGAAL